MILFLEMDLTFNPLNHSDYYLHQLLNVKSFRILPLECVWVLWLSQ
jgi:hypothetical protein